MRDLVFLSRQASIASFLTYDSCTTKSWGGGGGEEDTGLSFYDAWSHAAASEAPIKSLYCDDDDDQDDDPEQVNDEEDLTFGEDRASGVLGLPHTSSPKREEYYRLHWSQKSDRSLFEQGPDKPSSPASRSDSRQRVSGLSSSFSSSSSSFSFLYDDDSLGDDSSSSTNTSTTMEDFMRTTTTTTPTAPARFSPEGAVVVSGSSLSSSSVPLEASRSLFHDDSSESSSEELENVVDEEEENQHQHQQQDNRLNENPSVLLPKEQNQREGHGSEDEDEDEDDPCYSHGYGTNQQQHRLLYTKQLSVSSLVLGQQRHHHHQRMSRPRSARRHSATSFDRHRLQSSRKLLGPQHEEDEEEEEEVDDARNEEEMDLDGTRPVSSGLSTSSSSSSLVSPTFSKSKLDHCIRSPAASSSDMKRIQSDALKSYFLSRSSPSNNNNKNHHTDLLPVFDMDRDRHASSTHHYTHVGQPSSPHQDTVQTRLHMIPLPPCSTVVS